MTPLEALIKYFGHNSFRQSQQEIIEAIMKGENTLAVLPTGAGKSICFQIPALISENFSIVISPLIALMKDQVDSLNKNIKCSLSAKTFFLSLCEQPHCLKGVSNASNACHTGCLYTIFIAFINLYYLIGQTCPISYYFSTSLGLTVNKVYLYIAYLFNNAHSTPVL